MKTFFITLLYFAIFGLFLIIVESRSGIELTVIYGLAMIMALLITILHPINEKSKKK